MSEKETPTLPEVHNLIKDLRAELEKKSVDMNKVVKIEALLDAQESKNQEILAGIKQAEAKELELKERIDSLESEVARKSSGSNGADYKASPEYKALHALVVKGENRMGEEHKTLLRTDVDTAGGYLTTTEMDSAIIKQIIEMSDVRAVARVRSIGTKSLDMPKRTDIPTAAFEGEAEAGENSRSSYGSDTVTTYRQTVTIPVTTDMLMNSAFSMESEIFSDANEAFAKGEGNAFVAGTGVKMPEGFVVNAAVQADAIETASSGVLDMDSLISVTGELKVGYNPIYAFNRQTLAAIRKMKDSNGAYLWQPGVNGVVASTINGFAYRIMQDMPSIASSAYAVAFGDFLRGYTIIDRTGISIIRDETTSKKQAIVEFTLHRWLTGRVSLPEAIKLVKIKA